jgi:ferric iron reductase protein FhuF
MSFPNRSRAARRARRALALAVFAGATAGCSLDLVNPNGPKEEDVLSDGELILTTVIGLQAQYADNVLVFVRAPELVTDQWSTRPAALAADVSLARGNPDPIFGVVSDPFAAAYRISRTADLLRQNLPNVQGIGSTQRTQVNALTRLIEAMAVGHLTTQYERLPVRYDSAGAVPLPRDQVRDSVIAWLETARAEVGSLTPAQLDSVRGRVLDAINLPNSINAMLARYYLFDGQYQNAINAAQRVPLSSLSLLNYPGTQINPLFQYMSLGQLRYVGARREFFLEAEATDRRPTFWADRVPSSANSTTGTPDSAFSFRAYGGARNDPYPLYLPDEMKLIQAEAYARLGNLPEAARLINEVRSQGYNPTGPCAVSLVEPTGCNPPLTAEQLDTEAEVFRAVLYERRYELFNQGLRWEDLRRLAAFTTDRPAVNFLPFPQSECDRNPNSGC